MSMYSIIWIHLQHFLQPHTNCFINWKVLEEEFMQVLLEQAMEVVQILLFWRNIWVQEQQIKVIQEELVAQELLEQQEPLE